MPTCAELQAQIDALPSTDYSKPKPKYAIAGCPQEPKESSGFLWPAVGLVGFFVALAVLGFAVKRWGRRST
jgi:hypothetical protein